MSRQKKTKYQVCYRDEPDAYAFDWNKIPEEVLNYVDPDYIYNVLSLNEHGRFGVKSVVYFKEVKRFSKEYLVIPDSDFEFGV